MNKALPVILIVVIGLGIAAGAFFFFNKKDAGKSLTAEEEVETYKELSLEERPYVTLTPRADGHEFHLTIEKILKEAAIVEYELIYKNADGVTQGVPGSIKYKGESKIERDLLLGSCSSGKCKYDEGVEEGTFTVKFRDEKGKLITKMDSNFHLQSGATTLTSEDGKFSAKINGYPKATFFLVMNTMGLPANAPGGLTAGPYGVFTVAKKSTTVVDGGVILDGEGDLYVWSGNKWNKVSDLTSASSVGVFIKASSN